MRTSIRIAVVEDHAALVMLSRLLQEHHAAALPAIFRSGTHALPASRLVALLGDSASVVYVAEVDEAVAGFAIAHMKGRPLDRTAQGRKRHWRSFARRCLVGTSVGSAISRTRRGRAMLERLSLLAGIDTDVQYPARTATLDTIVVDPAYRGAGLGRALMGATQAWARGEGADRLELVVWDFNAGAIALYESLGFRTLTRTMSLELNGPEEP